MVPLSVAEPPSPASLKPPEIVTDVAALTTDVEGRLTASPACRVTELPVDSTVTPALTVRSSPELMLSPAVRATAPEPDTLAATVSGLAAAIVMLVPVTPLPSIVKEPVLEIRTMPAPPSASRFVMAVRTAVLVPMPTPPRSADSAVM